MLGNGSGVLSDDKRSIATFSENGVCYKAINPGQKRVIRYQVDEGLIVGNEKKRCDNALEVPDAKTIYFIELKGEDLKKAAVQIFKTVKEFSEDIKDLAIHGRIVCSRIPRPDVRSTQVVALERLLASKSGNLIKTSQLLEEKI